MKKPFCSLSLPCWKAFSATAQLLWCVCACSSRIFLRLGGTRLCPVSAVRPSPLHPPALLWWIPGAIQLIRSKCIVLKGNITFQCFTDLFAVLWFVFPIFFLFPTFRYFSVQPPCSPVTLHNSFFPFCSFEVFFFFPLCWENSQMFVIPVTSASTVCRIPKFFQSLLKRSTDNNPEQTSVAINLCLYFSAVSTQDTFDEIGNNHVVKDIICTFSVQHPWGRSAEEVEHFVSNSSKEVYLCCDYV